MMLTNVVHLLLSTVKILQKPFTTKIHNIIWDRVCGDSDIVRSWHCQWSPLELSCLGLSTIVATFNAPYNNTLPVRHCWSWISIIITIIMIIIVVIVIVSRQSVYYQLYKLQHQSLLYFLYSRLKQIAVYSLAK